MQTPFLTGVKVVQRHQAARLDPNHCWQRRSMTPPSQASEPGASQEATAD